MAFSWGYVLVSLTAELQYKELLHSLDKASSVPTLIQEAYSLGWTFFFAPHHILVVFYQLSYLQFSLQLPCSINIILIISLLYCTIFKNQWES